MEGFENKDYVVDKLLRTKPLGNVYKARRVSDGALCAIKELDVRQMSEEEREDALEEIRVLTTVRNENLFLSLLSIPKKRHDIDIRRALENECIVQCLLKISYFDAFRGKNKLYVVMEYCDEPDLGRHIKTRAENQKFFSEAQVWSYLIQILRGLVAVHSRGLIHRDVRSGNIIQLDSHAVKIGDIRVGKVWNEGPAATDIGNPQFVPPEVWQNKAYTFKSDVWAVGCVLYEMITLVLPFGGCSLPDMRAKVIEGTYQPIPTAFSTGLSNVLKLLLNPDQATRITARDMLVHPILQGFLHHAPAPAPMLRVRASQDKKTLGSIPALSPIPMELKSSYPTLVVPGDKQVLDGPTVESKQVSDSPGNRHQSGLSSERPIAPAVRSRIAPLLAPRAILSSRDNDEMLADVNRPASQSSKAKLPRVAMLSKVIPKSPMEASAAAPQSLPSTPRVNMKHFKTAYILSPKVDLDEFQTLNDRSDVSSLISAPGTLKSKALATPPKVVTPRREKSTESVRSVGSSRSDDSSIRIRAPIDVLDQSHCVSATPRRENSLDSEKSVASSRSGDSVIRVRAPIDISDAPQADVVAHNVDSLKRVLSSASVYSNGSITDVRATITELDPVRRMVLSDYLQPSLAGDGVVTHDAPEFVTPGIVDGPEPSQRLDDLTTERLSLGVEALDSISHPSMASTTEPVTSQSKLTTPPGSIPGRRDSVARKTSVTNTGGVKALGDVLDKRPPNSRSRRLSLDGTRNERPSSASDHSKAATSKRESLLGVRKSAAGNGHPTDPTPPANPQNNGTAAAQSRRPATSSGPQKPPSAGTRKKLQDGDTPAGRTLNSHGKDVKNLGGKTADSLKLGSATTQARKKISAHVPTVTPVNQSRKGANVFSVGSIPASVSAQSPPVNQRRKEGANFASGGSNRGPISAESPQKPIRSRRLSLDFPIKGREAQPMGRGLGHFTGLAI